MNGAFIKFFFFWSFNVALFFHLSFPNIKYNKYYFFSLFFLSFFLFYLFYINKMMLISLFHSFYSFRCHQRRRRSIINRIYYNTDTLNHFTQIPLQITNDPFAIQLFNGSSFYWVLSFCDMINVNQRIRSWPSRTIIQIFFHIFNRVTYF